MRAVHAALLAATVTLAGCAATQPHLVTGPTARDQVTAAERAFAKTMADRDLKGFESFLAHDTVFFSGPKPLHGPRAVVDFWKRFYEKPQAPFSWEPKLVEVVEGGSLAYSHGPVYDPQGKHVSCYNSIWRQESRGVWKIVFDYGSGAQECAKLANAAQ